MCSSDLSSETGILSQDDGWDDDETGDGNGDSTAVEKELEWDSLRSCMDSAASWSAAVMVASREVVS